MSGTLVANGELHLITGQTAGTYTARLCKSRASTTNRELTLARLPRWVARAVVGLSREPYRASFTHQLRYRFGVRLDCAVAARLALSRELDSPPVPSVTAASRKPLGASPARGGPQPLAGPQSVLKLP